MKRIFFFIAAIFSGLYILTVILSIIAAHSAITPVPPSSYIGNSPSNISIAEKPGNSADLKFAVIGDIQIGYGTAQQLLKLIKEQKCDFIVQTGDLVNLDEFFHYRLILGIIQNEDLQAPFFVVPGNHDVKNGHENFMNFLGQNEFHFVRNNMHFIFMDNAVSPLNLEHLRSLLEKGRARKVTGQFLFFHRPVDEPELTDKFAALVKEYNVLYVFCGHMHFFRREVKNGTVFVTNGRGGDYDSDNTASAGYAVIVENNKGIIKDTKIEVPEDFSRYWACIHALYGHVYAGLMEYSPAIWVPLVFSWVFLVLIVIKRLKD
ncbi:MAG: metallophosphoesterase [Planctomycetes bacterium]|nr:metallophosphoesterase [Planctomycetota bacterium]